MARELVWLTRAMVEAIHQDQLLEHGGLPGLRDAGLLESALARATNRLHYEPTSEISALGAAYAFGIATVHPFNDGNKRTAFLAMYTFLGLNGWDLEARETDVVAVMLALAAGNLSEGELSAWLEAHLVAASEDH